MIVHIVAALIGAAAVLIGALIGYRAFAYFLVDIRVYNEEGTPIAAHVLVTGGPGQTVLNRRTDREGRLELVRLKNGAYTAFASADGYEQAKAEFDQRDKQVTITMKRTVPGIALTPFPLAGWSVWGGISVEGDKNIITVDGAARTAGYVNERISRGLAGKKLILEIANSGASRYSNNRLFKATVNRNDRLLEPLNIPSLVNGEYLPAQDGRAEFTIPADFDGKLGFVFYEAELRGLSLTAFYE